jgi:hypothetical protein
MNGKKKTAKGKKQRLFAFCFLFFAFQLAP